MENPANPSKNAVIIICTDICFVCKEVTRFIPFVSSNKPVNMLLTYSDGMLAYSRRLQIEFIIFKLFNIDIMIENSTINPPISRIVEIALVILLLNIVPISEKSYDVVFIVFL